VIAENEEREPDKVPTVRDYTEHEIVAALCALDDVEFSRLEGISRGLARTAAMEPQELLHEAFFKMVTTRRCSIDVDIMGFAIGTMKSIASTAYRRRKKDAAAETAAVPRAANDSEFELAHDGVSPEDEALARIFYGECLARIEAMIADDEELQLLVMGLCDGLLGKKLEEALETDTKGLAAARRRLANRLHKAFPDGLPI
jgi:hypothetical protein